MFPGHRIAAVLGIAAAVTLMPSLGGSVSAQEVENTERLAGIERIDVRVDASWDELITRDAGGATEAQFIQALEMGFERTVAEADAAPSLVDDASYTVACHVDTFYDTGQIIYSFRAQLERPGQDGAPVIVWVRSWVGSFTTQQLHLMFTLGEQCAKNFLEEWKSAN